MSGTLRTVHCGLGPVGCSIAKEVHRRRGYTIVGGVDRDPDLIGKDLGLVCGIPAGIDVAIVRDLPSVRREVPGGFTDVVNPSEFGDLAEVADIAIVATSSSLESVSGLILELVRQGLNVISTCEELVYPWRNSAKLATALNKAATENNVSILGTGVNPGYLMDYLVAVLSGLSRSVTAVRVERVLDASARREAFQKKVGVGMSLRQFRQAVASGSLRHVGLRESVDMIASALDWHSIRVEETIEPVVRETEQKTAAEAAGSVVGVQQVATGFDGSIEKIELSFRASLGETNPHDRIVIEGIPPVDLTIAGGIHGDLATCNVIVNSIRPVFEASSGLLTMLEIKPPSSLC